MRIIPTSSRTDAVRSREIDFRKKQMIWMRYRKLLEPKKALDALFKTQSLENVPIPAL